jgi:hypothetical protein
VTKRAFTLTVPARSAGRYEDVNWDALLSKFRDEPARGRKRGKNESGNIKDRRAKQATGR